MQPAFIKKIAMACERHDPLSEDDERLLLGLSRNVHPFEGKSDIISEGDDPRFVHVMMEGWACRYKVLRDGSRQIVAFLLPGDFCDAHITLFGQMDHGIAALTDCQVALVPHATMASLMQRPRIARALWWAGLVDEAVLRAWIVNLGRRDALERLSHLILELDARMKIVGLAKDDSFDLPLTQEDLADALGLTNVHVNRMLRRLREDGLVTHHLRRLIINDIRSLRRQVGFIDNYLHTAQC